MRKLAVALVILLALGVVADRVAVSVAAGVVASQLRSSGDLRADPGVEIRGFPFLTQAVAGRYDRIELKATALSRGGVRLSTLKVAIVGARLGLSDALSGAVSSVPVEGLAATAVVTYADVAVKGRLPGATLVPVDGGVRVTGRVTVLGRSVSASTVSSVRLGGGAIVLTATSVDVEGQSSAALDAAVAARFNLRVPVGKLPYGLTLTGVEVRAEGLVLTATSGPTVLSSR